MFVDLRGGLDWMVCFVCFVNLFVLDVVVSLWFACSFMICLFVMCLLGLWLCLLVYCLPGE